MIGSRREGVQPLPFGGWMRLGAGAALAPLLAFALAGWLGNSALASAQSSLDGRNWQDAEHQASRAEAFMPWSSEPPMLSAEAHLGAGEIARARASARTAVDRSAGSWQAWLDLAIASSGRMRTEALARAKQLYPEGLEIADARKTFAEEAHRHPTQRVR